MISVLLTIQFNNALYPVSSFNRHSKTHEVLVFEQDEDVPWRFEEWMLSLISREDFIYLEMIATRGKWIFFYGIGNLSVLTQDVMRFIYILWRFIFFHIMYNIIIIFIISFEYNC